MDGNFKVEGLTELFSEMDELIKANENLMVAAVETCCDTGLLVEVGLTQA
ncbi:MAG: hypothetical protein HFI58_01520 [Lachnospiraceae bacterium]|jgi:hypothetical protein|nr:hypothetical protein [Lachnospiraceae bacterium]